MGIQAFQISPATLCKGFAFPLKGRRSHMSLLCSQVSIRISNSINHPCPEGSSCPWGVSIFTCVLMDTPQNPTGTVTRSLGVGNVPRGRFLDTATLPRNAFCLALDGA